jgi:hypothetical protein
MPFLMSYVSNAHHSCLDGYKQFAVTSSNLRCRGKRRGRRVYGV